MIADQELALPGWLAADLDDATSQVARFDAQSRGRVGALKDGGDQIRKEYEESYATAGQ
jgi:hypothetical protein